MLTFQGLKDTYMNYTDDSSDNEEIGAASINDSVRTICNLQGGKLRFLESTKEKIAELIRNEIVVNFSGEVSDFLYRIYRNTEEQIEKTLLDEISEKFVEHPAQDKYRDLRTRLFLEHKDEIITAITEDKFTTEIERVLLYRTSDNNWFSWSWKDKIAGFILDNWDMFKDDKRVNLCFLHKHKLHSNCFYLVRSLRNEPFLRLLN